MVKVIVSLSGKLSVRDTGEWDTRDIWTRGNEGGICAYGEVDEARRQTKVGV